MQKLCENCKYWVEADSIENWGVCAKFESDTKRAKGDVTGVLRRCDENCRDFKPTHETKATH